MFRISRDGRELVVDVDKFKDIEPAIRAAETGHYHIAEISADSLKSGQTSRHWGVGIKRADGSVELEQDACEA
jgi:hypothetical protein